MKDRSILALKGFLGRCPSDRREALEKFLPAREQELLSSLPPFTIAAEVSQNRDLLQYVHWSWFLPTLKSYSKTEQKFFLSALDFSTAKSLSEELNISPSKETLSHSGRSFLRQILLHSLVGPNQELLPSHILPPSGLDRLLSLSKKELTCLINHLSLYDLASELRQIVETKILKKLYSFLKEEEKSSLKTMMAHKELFTVPRIGLEKWDGTESTFRLLLHRRGLSRLATALAGQDPDFIWYLCHNLDIGRGNTLFKLCEKKVVSGLSEAVQAQVEEWLENI